MVMVYYCDCTADHHLKNVKAGMTIYEYIDENLLGVQLYST